MFSSEASILSCPSSNAFLAAVSMALTSRAGPMPEQSLVRGEFVLRCRRISVRVGLAGRQAVGGAVEGFHRADAAVRRVGLGREVAVDVVLGDAGAGQ